MKFCWMRIGAAGSADASVSSPRLSGCSMTTRPPKPSSNGCLNGLRYGPRGERRAGQQQLHVRHGRRPEFTRGERRHAARNVARDAGAAEQIGVGERHGDAVEPHRAVDGAGGAARSNDDHHGDVVLQVPADAAQRHLRLDAVRCAARPGSPMPDSISTCGELITPPASSTSRWRAHDRGSAALRYSTPTARPPSISDARHQRAGLDGEIVALQRRAQIGDRGAAAPAVADGVLVAADALVVGRC